MAKLLALPEVMQLLEQQVARDYPELARGRTHLPMCLVVTQTQEVLGAARLREPGGRSGLLCCGSKPVAGKTAIVHLFTVGRSP
jgi:hypothetical protein